LLTLGQSSLSDKEKIEECDKIILETIKFIDPIIKEDEKRELYMSVAEDIFDKRHYNNQIITREYKGGDVSFSFYVSAHDYSAGTDRDTIKQAEIEKAILLKSKSH